MRESGFFMDERFKVPRDQISLWRKKEKDWQSIRNGFGGDLDSFIKKCNDDFDWGITKEEWVELVDILIGIEEKSFVGYIGDPEVPLKPVSENDGSAWQKYRQKLISNLFSALSINNIERASQKIASQLRQVTEQRQPVRGIVVGNVQSGKTANMAGVISMCEDFGYNFFIVMSGTIDNLRKQTQERLISDLNSDNCSLNLISLPPLSGKTEVGSRLQDLRLGNGDTARYLYVCLKNTARLKDLLIWLNGDKSQKSKLKIVLIDDEADQAGINTANMDKNLISKINKQIKAIVFGQNHQYTESSPYGAMNYIGYTATPYANFLNEANDLSLYPTNFILTLNSPEEYIGPQQIFGLDDVNVGLPIVNTISDEEIEKIKYISLNKKDELPSELESALLWFICTAACFRYWDLKKPVSMLIHTSQLVRNHSAMADAVQAFLHKLSLDVNYLEKIESTWANQTSMLSISRFREEMPDFPKDQIINNYPDFDSIKPYIKELIEIGVRHILLNEEEAKLEYSNGLHLCVDNCSNNYVQENVVLRLIYPDKNTDSEIIKKCPAFIVIGGSTLSRGLTLEGLTTSYFVRTTILADALMQMGRWFGFRRKYELLPRLWLSKRVEEQYKFLTILDTELREELHNMESLGMFPKDYAPRLNSFPYYKLLAATSKNKMQNSYEIAKDFSNKKGQTTRFYSDPTIINSNFEKVIHYIDLLGPIDKKRISNLKNDLSNEETTFMWFDKPFEDVVELLCSLEYPFQSALIQNKEDTIKWFSDQLLNGYLKNFTVIVSSNISGEPILNLKHVNIHLPSRRKLRDPDSKGDTINLKILTRPNDLLLDIDMSNLTEEEKNEIINLRKLTSSEKRIMYGLANTPLLVLYVIDKNSGKGMDDSGDRLPLQLNQHLAGYYIYIPYGNNGNDKKHNDYGKLVVRLDFLRSDIEDEDENPSS